jgi:hypothetical protein
MQSETRAEFDDLKLVLTTISQAVKNIRSIERGRGREANRAAHQFVASSHEFLRSAGSAGSLSSCRRARRSRPMR